MTSKHALWDKKYPPSQRVGKVVRVPVNMEGGIQLGSCPPIPKESADRIDRIAEETRKRIGK